MGQINNAMTQLNQTTQQSAASSEELAATAEELAGQAQQLQALVAFFRLDESMQNAHARAAAAPVRAKPAAHKAELPPPVHALATAGGPMKDFVKF